MAEQISSNFLDQIDSKEALDWARSHNERTMQQLGTERFAKMKTEIKDALDDPGRIPFARIRDDWAYNFWTDDDHPRGIWRRQLASQYLGVDCDHDWDVLLDVDQLAKTEGKSWVWRGASVVYPEYTRALIFLSDGGSDKDVVREFDIQSRSFVDDGFSLPESKGFAVWISPRELLVGRDFGPGTMTRSGYPRQVRRWKRGQALEDAEVIFEVSEGDVGVFAGFDPMPGWKRLVVQRMIDFYSSETYIADPDEGTQLRKVPVPDHVQAGAWRDWMLMLPKKDWEYRGQTFPAGSLVVAKFDDVFAETGEAHALFTPTKTTALADITLTRNHVIVNVLDNVANRLEILTPPVIQKAGWERRELELHAPGEMTVSPPFATIRVGAVNRMEEDRLWITTTSFVTPTALSIIELSPSGKTMSARNVYVAPTMFDAEDLEVSQHFATSLDGTQIPYFQVSHRSANGPQPTLLYGYGGFEVSLTPAYPVAVGRAWLARGGTYVIANIRGGGEFGPAWHQAAIKEHRHRAYEDFAAVADDLVARGVTTPAQLGAQGGSNGGLLTGMMLTKYPEKFGAIVCQVPLLDMRRYHTLLAGASWMAEYGDPDDPDQWKYIQTFSPYHLFRADGEYPPVLFTTSTRDDRVHPAHARRMVAKMEAAGKDVLFYENTEGGHAGAADNEQRAQMSALGWEFLWQKLTGSEGAAE